MKIIDKTHISRFMVFNLFTVLKFPSADYLQLPI